MALKARTGVAIRHIPAVAIPARDRPTVAAMQTGKRVTNFQFDQLRTDVQSYIRSRQRQILRRRMEDVAHAARRGVHAH